MVEVLSTGSHGNAVLYNGCILVSCGVPFSVIKPVYKKIQLVFIDHVHRDHFNLTTIKKLAALRPGVRFGCCSWMLPHLQDEVKNIDIYEIGKLYNYGSFKLAPIKLYHDVPNAGLRLFFDDIRLFHATDTAHLGGITAKGYDYYCIEHNYDEDTIHDIIKEKESRGEYAHQRGAINSHLSCQQAQNFFIENKKDDSVLIRLHESSSSL